MKQIQVSDHDYDTLMELSKELQLQDNDWNAFPYFWEPMSKKEELNFHGEGEIVKVYNPCYGEGPEYPEDTALYNEDLWVKYCESMELALGTPYSDEHQDEWIEFLESNGYDKLTFDMNDVSEHNPSLFKQDVKDFIGANRHHLGKDPHTYARTFFRMPRMAKLIEAIYRLNKQPIGTINKEASRFVYNETRT